MYLQITTRCNMACDHCCYSCLKAGTDMSREVLVAALDLAQAYDDQYVTIGGGEPTLHRHFWDYFGLVMSRIEPGDGFIHVATNGTVEKSALQLARLARAGIIHAELSRTEWHRTQRVQPSAAVIAAFTRGPRSVHGYGETSHDLRGIREETGRFGTPFAVGRAADWGEPGCCCDTLHVDPDGTLYACGCRIERLGTVFRPEIPDDYFGREERCSKERAEPQTSGKRAACA